MVIIAVHTHCNMVQRIVMATCYFISVTLILAVGTASSIPVNDPIAEPPPVTTLILRAANNLTINIQSNGNYQILQNDTIWLHSGSTFFQSRGKMYSTDAGNLLQDHFGPVESGWDNLGEYSSVSTTWQAQDCDFGSLKSDDEPIAEPPPCTKSTVITSIRAYKLSPLLVFSQNFKNVAFSGTSVNDQESVCTGFPTFQVVSTSSANLGYMSYGSKVLQTARMGRWQKGAIGIQSGLWGGPLVLFDQLTQHSMIMAPFREFMTGSIHYNTWSNAVEWGVMGSVTSIPKDYNYETAIVFAPGIKQAVISYGDILLKHYGKSRDAYNIDFTSNYLGYWTDNGAYYYKHTAPNMTYDETLMKVKDYSDGLNIPYRYFQLDSWWYYRGVGGGVQNWTARPDIFPKGLQDFRNRLQLPLAAHNRFWSGDTQYAKTNGGKWNFIVEKEKSIPQDEGFWNYLMSTSKEWGLAMYEQDWLAKQFEEMTSTLQNISVAKTWLNTMGAGAAMSDIAIQFCQPMPRFLLQSVQMPTVTQSRASIDYQPGNSQWNIGVGSIMFYALRIKPFKDTFWTTKTQPGNIYGLQETNPQLQSVVATLSTGPVGPGDMIGYANATLIMRSCNAEGKLLQPSRPAMTVTGSILALAFGNGTPKALSGMIWSTYSEIPYGMSKIVFGHVLVLEVGSVTMLTPSSADLGSNMMPPSMVYSDNDPLNSVAQFDEKVHLTLQPLTDRDFQLWHTTPIMKLRNNTVLILGELSKWVKVSPDRITDISLTQEALSLSMTGAANEKVTMAFMLNMKSMSVTCTFPESRKVILKVVDMGKASCITT
ncbi:uncharacterized protein [Amphiura filiformis]|uniref:uncharacterized protein isoform X2 n=1 Tax=Amphiura filiformis TaxID=82378 RepID=UPI003B2174B1